MRTDPVQNSPTNNGRSAHNALPEMMKAPVRTSTARSSGA